jgi:hypothetical protein
MWLRLLAVVTWCLLGNVIMNVIIHGSLPTVIMFMMMVMYTSITRYLMQWDIMTHWEWIVKSKFKAEMVPMYLHRHASIYRGRYYIYGKHGKPSRVAHRGSRIKAFHLATANVFLAKTDDDAEVNQYHRLYVWIYVGT